LSLIFKTGSETLSLNEHKLITVEAFSRSLQCVSYCYIPTVTENVYTLWGKKSCTKLFF